MNVKYDFSGKTALVVGGGTGIGKATALLLAESGANVMVADINADLGKTVIDEIKANGGIAEFVICDIRNKESAFNAVAETVKTFGRIDFGANVAGIAGKVGGAAFHELEDGDYENVMAINVDGHRWLLQAEITEMVKQGGEGYSIVEVTSVQGFIGQIGAHQYSASKHAMVGMVKSVGAEYASKGIRVNGIAPGTTATEFVKDAYKKLGWEFSNKTDRLPRGTMLEPVELAHAIAWLFSDGASAMNGTTFAVDGGLLAVK